MKYMLYALVTFVFFIVLVNNFEAFMLGVSRAVGDIFEK